MKYLLVFSCVFLVNTVLSENVTGKPEVVKSSTKKNSALRNNAQKNEVSEKIKAKEFLETKAKEEIIQNVPDDKIKRVFVKSHPTRLTKSLLYGFYPYFDTNYFEPFEARPKTITVVAFRKNGYQPRGLMTQDSSSQDVAEMQSPYNTIGQFWADQPGVLG